MEANAETFTVIPAMASLVLSIFLAFYSLQLPDPTARNLLFITALSLFYAGILLALGWAVYWGIYRKIK